MTLPRHADTNLSNMYYRYMYNGRSMLEDKCSRRKNGTTRTDKRDQSEPESMGGMGEGTGIASEWLNLLYLVANLGNPSARQGDLARYKCALFYF